jgi:hypothetical protein
VSARGWVEVDARPKRAAEHPDFVGGGAFYRPDQVAFSRYYHREKARLLLQPRVWDLIAVIFLVLTGAALASTWFTPAQLKAAWMSLPFIFPLMMRVCAWCDAVLGEKCERCGAEAREVAGKGSFEGAQLFRCVNPVCEFQFERHPAKVTHTICMGCVAKKKREAESETPAAMAKAVSA